MFSKWSYHTRLFLVAILSVVFIKGCYSFSPDTTYSPKSNLFTAECRTVKHELGESCIPFHPKRIIVTDQESLEILVALGLKPIATTTANRVGNKTPILKDKIDVIIDLGKESSLNLEKVIKLNPDLIVGFTISPHNYQLFSQIAPTVSIDFTERNWKKTFLQFANVVDKTQLATQMLAEYQERVKKLKFDFAQKLGNIKISVMRFYTTLQFTQFMNKLSFPVSILYELNLSIPLEQIQVSGNTPNVSYNNVSLERVDLLESDAMFIALDPGAKENFQKYQNSPLWHTLNVVKNNRVYTVDSGYWIFGNILSANAILDDLVKYLLVDSDIPKN
ncbi:iron-siderophore ABC transporter substrate-binding protein [Anabaena subtropica FACHB-260]|uniref:Iron-siderophore ABC transporter substrate-binding protein n=1 Tax=Anabaena subtropica FACHB-260 TaxID=2692884 RepID=A0ABR8CSN4_9NOST|nr:iron-siderophore ABC transporter substrate-binding protein [Anabaena subtropica FACHB-260]